MNARMNPGGMSASSSQGKGGPVSAAPTHQPMSSGATTMNHMSTSGKPGGSAQPNQNVLEAVKKVSLEIVCYPSLTGGVMPGAGGGQATVPAHGPKGARGRGGGEGWGAEPA